jgi:ShK domain-like
MRPRCYRRARCIPSLSSPKVQTCTSLACLSGARLPLNTKSVVRRGATVLLLLQWIVTLPIACSRGNFDQGSVGRNDGNDWLEAAAGSVSYAADSTQTFPSGYVTRSSVVNWASRNEPTVLLGVPQAIVDPHYTDEVLNRLNVARNYVKDLLLSQHENDSTRGNFDLQAADASLASCRNQHESCTYWAVVGECTSNPSYMNQYCAPVCSSCSLAQERQNKKERNCPSLTVDPMRTDTFVLPGELNEMFTRITTDPRYSYLNITVHSWPKLSNIHQSSQSTAGTFEDAPWVITMENAISDAEANRMIELGMAMGYKTSLDLDEENPLPDGSYAPRKPNNGRTSTNACT